jgi:hypothetical protein
MGFRSMGPIIAMLLTPTHEFDKYVNEVKYG